MTELLRPSPLANLICLEFPTQKSGTSGGPPWASPPSAYVSEDPVAEKLQMSSHILMDREPELRLATVLIRFLTDGAFESPWR